MLTRTADEGAEWAERSAYWLAQTEGSSPKRLRRQRNDQPLILTGHGASLRVDNGALLIKDGFTHYPQQQKTYRFFPGALDRPPRIILLDGGGTISFDVLSWLAEQDVTLVRVTWKGEATCVAGGAGFVADPAKVHRQAETRSDPIKRLDFCKGLIRRKLLASIETLQQQLPDSNVRQRAVAEAQQGMENLDRREVAADVSDVLGVEGRCANAYFAAWSTLPIKWVGTSRHPIPDDWRTYRSRSSLANAKIENVNASHPINAMLNYAYAVLQSQVQIDVVSDGYDPTVGIMHNTFRGTPAFVFDQMEPMRPVVDCSVLEFVRSQALHASDFTITPGGVCRLNPELARCAASSALQSLR